MSTIVKIQRSLATTEKKAQMLIYNEKRTITHESDLTPEIEKLMGQNLKIYAEASVRGGVISVSRAVRNQGW